jgi:hypothetical protein
VEVFDRCCVYVNGDLQALAVDVTVGNQNADQVISLLGQGSKRTMALAPGGRYLTIEWSSAVSQDGVPLRLWETYNSAEPVQVRVVQMGGGSTITSNGYLQAPSVTSTVGQNQSVSNSFVGEPAEWV